MSQKEKTMHNTTKFMILGLVCLGSLATAQSVTYNFDEGADFSKFKTYKWIDIPGGVDLNQILDKSVKNAFDAQLIKKGLSKTEGDNADLYVGYQLAVSQERQVNSYTTGGAGWGYGARWGGGMATTTATTSTIHNGTLLLDMYDPSPKQLVWRGKAMKTLDVKAKQEKQQKNLSKAAAKMLKNYPPPVKK
jgi:Domain of unknown function (DUF4136)